MASSTQQQEELIRLFLRLGAKFAQLEKKAVDLGTGEKLFPTELHTIEAVGKGSAQTVTSLCNYFDVTKGAVSQVITRLQKKGYVEKQRNDDFAKEKIITLTAKGQKAFEAHQALHRKMDKAIANLLAKYTDQELAVLEDFLQIGEKQVQRFLDL